MKKPILICLFLAALGPQTYAQDRALGCRIDSPKLDCTANGASDADRAEAMASTVTFAVLRKQLESPDFSKTAAGRELFRRSLESNRSAVERALKAKDRAFERGKMSAAEHKAARQAYTDAIKNYHAGMLVHNSGIWNDPEGAEAD